MAFELGFSTVSDVHSRASSRTLTPVGARSEKDFEDLDAGARTPPRRLLWSPLTLKDEYQLSETDFSMQKTLACGFEAEPLSTMQPEILANHVVLPGPVKAMMTTTQEPPVPSKGSVGHPYTCGNACKYFRRKGGCNEGENCSKCHLCHWSRDPTQQKPAVQGVPIRVAVALSQDRADDGELASVGSMGHPFSCNVACKYNSKKSGCKDGKQCSRCHLCPWRRSCEKNDKADNNEHSLIPESRGTILQETSAFFPKLNFTPQHVDIQQQFGSEMPMKIAIKV